MTPARHRGRLAALAVASALFATACSGASGSVARRPVPAPAANDAPEAREVAPLKHRIRPDLVVAAPKPLPPKTLTALRKLAPAGVLTFRSGWVVMAGHRLRVAGVDPSRFRAFAPAGTAESDQVWSGVARDELVVAHDVAAARHLALGSTVAVRGLHTARLRVAAFATTVPDVGAVVSDRVADVLGLPRPNAALVSAGTRDAAALAAAVRKTTGGAVTIDLLTQPETPYAFLTGSRAAKAFGAFSYRWFDDGTIEPDARWVRANIVTARVPILGYVTCHRLMVPQLRAALADVQSAGLAGLIHTYNGCYVPRFIERDPSHAVSLHTWGIAIDIDSATNQRGIRGTMDPRVVAIFKRWGFNWGGDWTYTDPMHFELGALITSR